jgi:hypothetical protein
MKIESTLTKRHRKKNMDRNCLHLSNLFFCLFYFIIIPVHPGALGSRNGRHEHTYRVCVVSSGDVGGGASWFTAAGVVVVDIVSATRRKKDPTLFPPPPLSPQQS